MKLAFALVLATVSVAHADDTTLQAAAPQRTLGIDGAVVMPFGNYADAAGVGAGAFGRLEFPVSTGGFVTARIGLIAHQVDATMGGSLMFVPIYGGYRQPLGPGGAYLAGELGITFGYASVNTGQFGRVSDTDSELGITLMAGLRKGALDFRAGLFAPDIDDVHGFMASLGYNFSAF